MSEAQRNLDESSQAKKISGERESKRLKAQKDANGISSEMMESMVQTIAEGLHTGATDMRHLLYCAFRNAQAIQKQTP